MKNFISIYFVALLLLTSCGTKSEVTVWKLGHIFPENNIFHTISLKFAEEVENKTEGKLKIQVYPNSLEGNEVDNLNGIRVGVSHMTLSGDTMQNWAPKAALIGVPYSFQTVEGVKVAVNGEIGQEIEQDIIEKVAVVPLFNVLRLPRNLTSNRPIRTPKDLNNLIVRVPDVPLYITMWQSAGAKPTPMSLGEVFTALQQGTIDGQENPNDVIYTSGFQEVQKYVNLTEHIYSWLYLVVGKEVFESLSPEMQAHVWDAAKVAQEFGYEEFDKLGDKYETLLKESGVEFVEVDKEAFRNVVRPKIEADMHEDIKPLYRKIVELSSQY